jgi:plastocyanin
VDAGILRSVLGITDVTFIPGRGSLAVVDATLSGKRPAFDVATSASISAKPTIAPGPNEIGIDNFRFTPVTLRVARGTSVKWINNDDVPHLITSADLLFKSSPVLDSGQRYSVTLSKVGSYRYFCSLHPQMQGTIVVS